MRASLPPSASARDRRYGGKVPKKYQQCEALLVAALVKREMPGWPSQIPKKSSRALCFSQSAILGCRIQSLPFCIVSDKQLRLSHQFDPLEEDAHRTLIQYGVVFWAYAPLVVLRRKGVFPVAAYASPDS